MAEDVLVKETLTPDMISAGKALIEELAKQGFNFKAAFWLFESDQFRWRLYLGSAEVDSRGPRFGYDKVNQAMKERPEIPLTLEDISVVPLRNLYVVLLSRAISTGGAISGIRFSRNSIDGHFIQDAYIYKA